jgi:ATP-dependent Lhr-like helicase
VLAALERERALFFADLVRASKRLPSETEDGLWELVAAGLVTADGFENVRALIDPKRRRGEGKGRNHRPRHSAGRWALVHRNDTPEQCLEKWAEQLLVRWGVLLRDLLAREAGAPPWRDLLPVLRRMEAQGKIRGGRFMSGFTGEQFARPEALDLMRAARRAGDADVAAGGVANADPLNLAGIILPGARVSPIATPIPMVAPAAQVDVHPQRFRWQRRGA